jgi:hypothetical protein
MDAIQRQEVERILSDTRDQLHRLRRAQFEQVRAVLDSTRARLEPLLTPEQQERLQRMIERDPFRGPGRDRPGPPGRDRRRRPPSERPPDL